jgi:hypothetical protein
MEEPKTNKEKLMKGVRFLAIAFPFIFAGPIVLTIAFSRDEPWLLVLAAALVLTAFYFAIRGLTTVLSAFFDR